MTVQEMIQANPYTQNSNVYNNVPVPCYYPPQKPINQINYKSDKYSVNAYLSNTGLVCCGLAAVAIGAGVGYYMYKKFSK